jgi:hypothetical protein
MSEGVVAFQSFCRVVNVTLHGRRGTAWYRQVFLVSNQEIVMAKKAKKGKYSRSSGSDVKGEMHRYKKGTAKSGRGGKGGKVKSRKQAIAIGLSKARKKGKKVPKKRTGSNKR